MSALRVLIAEPRQDFRERLRALLESRANLVICAEVADGRAAIESARELQPDLILLEYTLPIIDGLEAAGLIRESKLEVPILLISLHQSSELFSQAKAIGVSGYVSKTDAAETLLHAIDILLQGGSFFPAEG